MTIYKVRPDVNRYQYFLYADPNLYKDVQMFLIGEPRLASWVPPDVFIYQPLLRRGHFLGLAMSSLVCDHRTVSDPMMCHLLEMAGELLPLPHEGETFYVLNPLDCVNALDRERSEWHPSMSTKAGGPQKYMFHRDRLPQVPLFKIPETARTDILCAAGTSDPTYEFKRRYEALGLTGLIFQPLWSDEDPT